MNKIYFGFAIADSMLSNVKNPDSYRVGRRTNQRTVGSKRHGSGSVSEPKSCSFHQSDAGTLWYQRGDSYNCSTGSTEPRRHAVGDVYPWLAPLGCYSS